jgi:hypothetical protein
MKKKNWEELSYDQKSEFSKWFANWLKNYTEKVIIAVLEKRDEILNNESSLNLLKELYFREQKENIDFEHSIRNLLDNFDDFKKYNPHNHVLEHAGSYRDVLYDLYIRDTHNE